MRSSSKIRRPGVLQQAKIDFDLLRSAADLIERRSETGQLLQLSALAGDVEQHLLAELDFTEEANNTAVIGRSLAGHPDLVVPEVVWPHVSEQILVLEHIGGRKVTADHGLEPELLASAWMARVNDAIAVVGFTVTAVLGLYMLWKILRTPGSL